MTATSGAGALVGTGGAEIVVDDLGWRPFGRETPVLEGLQLVVPAGQRVLLAGPSGSGKSTLLRAVAGVLASADSGERTGSVRVGGHDPQAQPGLVGLVLQDPGAGVVAAGVARDVAFGLENRAMPREQMAPVVVRALERVGLAALADAPTATLSGGESQRLALAGALALSPGALLLDEPLAMLDAATRDEVVDAVTRAVGDDGLTLLVVEHRLGPWLPHVDRLLVMDEHGALVADGPPAEVLATERARLLDLGVWVPGEPDPVPLTLDLGARAGAASVCARDVAVDRVSRPANRPPRVVRAVEGVDLDIPARACAALVGPSGSGKSSLLLALAGLERPASGEVQVAGVDPASLEGADVPRTVAWVPQSPAAGLVRRTVGEEIAVEGASAEVVARHEALLRAIGLADRRDADVAALSGGEQRRLAVAAAVVAHPAVLLTDEMTIGQDRHTWAAVVGIAEAVAASGGSVVHATHDDALVARCESVHALPARGAVPPSPTLRRSLGARGGPLSLVLAAMVAVVASLAVSGWRSGLAGVGATVLLGALALWAPGPSSQPGPTGRLRALAWRLGPILLAALGLAWSTWLLGGRRVDLAVEGVLRMLVAVLPSAVLLPLVDPDELGDHLAQRLHLPARPVVALGAALQRLQGIADLRTTLERARRMRGLGPRGDRIGHAAGITVAVLVEVLGAASRLAVAMDARGFAGARRRTWAQPAPWRLVDSLVVLLGLVPLGVVLLVR